MAKVLGFLIRYFSNYYTLHRGDLAARAAPLDPRLSPVTYTFLFSFEAFNSRFYTLKFMFILNSVRVKRE